MTHKALIGCAGFGGVDIVLRAAGFETVGIELDPAIAEVNRFNGGNVIAADLLTINPADYIGWSLYHFSPPCPSFSVANHKSTETEIDIFLARKICEFIRIGRPPYFTLENVWMYRRSLSWLLIWYTLLEEGYGVDAWHLNAADYGVPQTRRRMIVIARRDGQQPTKPWPTHQKQPDMFSERWCGWYEAIEDLIPELSETRFAPWQENAMPDEWASFILGQTDVKAFVMASANTGSNNGNGTIRAGGEPMFTVLANSGEKNAMAKAFVGRIVSMTIRCLARFQDFPDWFVLPGEGGLIDNPILLAGKRPSRELACHGIGNALPPGMYRAVLKSLGLGLDGITDYLLTKNYELHSRLAEAERLER